jgi:hypothetical protein
MQNKTNENPFQLFEEFYKSITPEMRPPSIHKHDYSAQRHFWSDRFMEAFKDEKPSLRMQSYTELPVMWLAGRKSQHQSESIRVINLQDLYSSKVIVALEQRVENQVEASGMDSRRLERLDGEKLIDTVLKVLAGINSEDENSKQLST